MCLLFNRKVGGKNGADVDVGPSARSKRKADIDGAEEVVFAKKPNLVSANDLK